MSLSDIGGTGDTDKNLFVQENTVVWGHLRSKNIKQGHFRFERVENDEKGLESIKKGWNIH